MKPFRKSEPIPEVNDQPVKVVVADSLHDVVFTSGKNGKKLLYGSLIYMVKIRSVLLKQGELVLF